MSGTRRDFLCQVAGAGGYRGLDRFGAAGERDPFELHIVVLK